MCATSFPWNCMCIFMFLIQWGIIPFHLHRNVIFQKTLAIFETQTCLNIFVVFDRNYSLSMLLMSCCKCASIKHICALMPMLHWKIPFRTSCFHPAGDAPEHAMPCARSPKIAFEAKKKRASRPNPKCANMPPSRISTCNAERNTWRI